MAAEPLPKASPALAAGLADSTGRIYSAAELELVTVITTRVRSALSSPDPAAHMLADSQPLQADATRITSRLERDSATAVRKALSAAYRRGHGRDNTAIDRALRTALEQLRALSDAIRRWVRSLWQRLTGLTIAEPDRDRQRALLGHALQREADRGVTAFTPSGRRSVTSLATATVRHRAGLTVMQGFMDDLVTSGDRYVIVNRTPTACPRCRPWVGKILSIAGDDPERPSVWQARMAGLWHPNCVHTVFRWYPGFRWPEHSTEGGGGTQDDYEQVQRQRAIERHIRRWKLREAAALDDVTRMQAKRKVRQWQGELRTHLAAHGLQRSRQRERIDYGHTRPLRHAHG